MIDKAQTAIVAISVALTTLALALYLFALPHGAMPLPFCIIRCEDGDIRRSYIANGLILLLAMTAIATDISAQRSRGWIVILASLALVAILIVTIFGIILIAVLFPITVIALWTAIARNWVTMREEKRSPSRATVASGLALAAISIPAVVYLYVFPSLEAAAKIAAKGQPYCFAQPAPRLTSLVGKPRASDLSFAYMLSQGFSHYASPYAYLITPSGSSAWSFRKSAFVGPGAPDGFFSSVCPKT
jgi:hypothetical protein